MEVVNSSSPVQLAVKTCVFSVVESSQIQSCTYSLALGGRAWEVAGEVSRWLFDLMLMYLHTEFGLSPLATAPPYSLPSFCCREPPDATVAWGRPYADADEGWDLPYHPGSSR